MEVLMQRPNWPNLERRVSRHGVVCWYVRVGHGERVRLRSQLGTPEFRIEYEAAQSALLKGERPSKAPEKGPSQGTMSWLWEEYMKSSAWAALAPSTKKQRENLMLHVLEGAAGMPIAKVTKSVILAGRERRSDTPFAANNYLKTVRGLFAWALEAEHVAVNPCIGVSSAKKPKGGGYPEWTDEDEAKFIARWPLGTRQYLALMVHVCTGLRRGDAVRLGRQHFKKGVISIKSAEKNGVELTIPLHPKLAEAINACPPSGLHILETSYGKPWVKESYGNDFHDWTKAAGVVQEGTGRSKNSHGIRKLAATRIAEAGASEAELMALFGWTDPGMARHYTKAANAKKLALQAAMKGEGYAEVLGLFGDQS
jgi:integrase